MIPRFGSWNEATLDLAIDRFTVGLDESHNARLQAQAAPEDLLDFELGLAAIHLAGLDRLDAPPLEVMQRLNRLGRDYSESIRQPAERLPNAPGTGRQARRFPIQLILGLSWAALLILTFLVVREAAPGEPAQLRAALIARAGDLIQLEWTITEDPLAQGASGNLVWSAELQEGYMRFRGLPPNDPRESQYQLWIFDSTRADWEAKPVDGGVFDVLGNDAVVAIDAKLPVRKGALFAVTVEVPGGVVVSKREKLVLLAQP